VVTPTYLVEWSRGGWWSSEFFNYRVAHKKWTSVQSVSLIKYVVVVVQINNGFILVERRCQR